MSKPFEPNGLLPDMTQFDEMTKAYRNAMPREFANTVNLLAHPAAGFAAAGALSLGMASHAIGLWMGAVAGMVDASRKLVEDASLTSGTQGDKPVKLKLVSTTPTPRAAAAKRAVAVDAEVAVHEPFEATPVDAVAVPVAMAPAKAAPARKAATRDDLKAISGIGPKLEKVLNGLGIETYDHIATLTPAEIAKLDEQLGFAGRIERDDWLGQASKLAGKVEG